ncbi:MAG: cation:proton antiporter [Candidatus Micrarchaeota archaeon]
MQEQFFILGLILLAGFVANWIFARTRVSQVLILLALGFLLGPVAGIVDSSKGSVLADLTPFVGALALIILLFDGGITLNVFDLVKVLPRATAFTLFVFATSIGVTAILAKIALGWGWGNGLLLGAAVGGTSAAIVLAMLDKARASQESKSLLALESTATDALCIVTAFVIIQVLKSNVAMDASSIANLIAASFSIALMAGVAAAALWLIVLRKLNKHAFPYMLTIAVVFLLYALVETARGNGGIAVFAFGLVLGNAQRVAETFKLKGDYALKSEIMAFQGEVTFFTRTFFFVFLGLVITLEGITPTIAGIAAALSILLLLARKAAQKIILPQARDAQLVTYMMPRGLAAAVLAGLPAAQGLRADGFVEITLIVIIISNVIATLGVLAQPSPQKLRAAQPTPPATEPPGKPRIVPAEKPPAK